MGGRIPFLLGVTVGSEETGLCAAAVVGGSGAFLCGSGGAEGMGTSGQCFPALPLPQALCCVLSTRGQGGASRARSPALSSHVPLRTGERTPAWEG